MITDVENNQYLAVDIGGTKTVVALYSREDPLFLPLRKKQYSSKQYRGVEQILKDFLSQSELRPSAVSLGIAGVVDGLEAKVTNLPWTISKQSLLQLGFEKVSLINDMTALTASIPLLKAEDLHLLQEGGGGEGDVAAVLAPGTGLGEGYLLYNQKETLPRGCEGGHCDFAPVNDEQIALLKWLGTCNSSARVTYEMVCAGPAIGTLYDFYFHRGLRANDHVSGELAKAGDLTPVIIEAALDGRCEVCTMAVTLFLKILGREAANLVMKVYATRGLFLGGGILPRLIGRIPFSPLLEAMNNQAIMNDLIAGIPVAVIVRKDAPLLGAAWFGRQLMLGEKQ